ncbi:MAG: cupin domain-containing protein [Candidatus Bathyarchaeia archaeon]
MKAFSYRDVEARESGEGSSKVKVRWLITKEMGAPNFAMRLFEVAAGGFSPLHSHAWEHEVFVLEGNGVVVTEEGNKRIGKGDVVFVAPNEKHQFKNNSGKPLKFLCIVPHKKE